jgi:hypothetical protein
MSSENPQEVVQSEHSTGAENGTPDTRPLSQVNTSERPEVSARRQSHLFTDEQKDKMLKALVLANMQPKLAKRRLERENIVVSHNTLQHYKIQYADRLEVLANQRAWVAEGQAETYEGLTEELTALAQQTAEHVAKRSDWDDMNIASLGKLITSLMTGAAIATDKARILRDMPTIITETRDLAGMLQALDKYSNVVKVNKDLIEVEVVEEPAPALPLPESEAA